MRGLPLIFNLSARSPFFPLPFINRESLPYLFPTCLFYSDRVVSRFFIVFKRCTKRFNVPPISSDTHETKAKFTILFPLGFFL